MSLAFDAYPRVPDRSNHAKVQGWDSYNEAACQHCRTRFSNINKYTKMPRAVKGGTHAKIILLLVVLHVIDLELSRFSSTIFP